MAEIKVWNKVQPTFRVFPSTQRLWRALRDKDIDVARYIDDQLRKLAKKNDIKL